MMLRDKLADLAVNLLFLIVMGGMGAFCVYATIGTPDATSPKP